MGGTSSFDEFILEEGALGIASLPPGGLKTRSLGLSLQLLSFSLDFLISAAINKGCNQSTSSLTILYNEE
jgi:hypothetical protein